MSPLIVIAGIFSAGVCLGKILAIGPPLAGSILVPLALVMIWAIGQGRHFLWIALLVAFASGWCAVPVEQPVSDKRHLAPCLRIVKGEIVSYPLELADSTRIEMRLSHASDCLEGVTKAPLRPLKARLFLTMLSKNKAQLGKGDRVIFSIKPTPLQFHKNPLAPYRLPDQGLYTGILKSDNAIIRVGSTGWSFKLISSLRRRLGDFWSTTLDMNNAYLARALVLGEANILTQAQKQAFRKTGAAHLLAISGLHLGIVAGVCFWVFRFCFLRLDFLARRWPAEKMGVVFTIGAAVFFAGFTGARVPVMRACLMLICVLSGRLFDRQPAGAQALAISAIVLLAADPLLLFTCGFQLSFAAVIAFLWSLGFKKNDRFDSTLCDKRDLRHRVWDVWIQKGIGFFKQLFLSSAAAFAATTPILLGHFETISLVTVPINMVILPVCTLLLMPGLLFVSMLSFINYQTAQIMAWPIDKLLTLIGGLIEWIAQFDVGLQTPDTYITVGIWCSCAAVLLVIRGYKKSFWILLIAAGFALAGHYMFGQSPMEKGVLTVDFLDTGQGDATLVTFPDGKHWLIDAGGTAYGHRGVGTHLIVPVLKRLGVKKIETLVLTHPDPDHVGGMAAIVRAFEVGNIWDNGQGEAESADPSYAEFLDLAKQMKIPVIRPLSFCGKHEVSGIQIKVIHPCEQATHYDPSLSFNDNSIVIHISFGLTTFLFPGDLSLDGEVAVMDPGKSLQADVLKLGHHGSKTSSSRQFLDKVEPKIAVAAVGLFNAYRMPHQQVQAALRDRNASLYRTDTHGAIRVVSNGKVIRVTRQK